jgi:hypothetical protein
MADIEQAAKDAGVHDSQLPDDFISRVAPMPRRTRKRNTLEDLDYICAAVDLLIQRVQELEKALKSAASTAHYRGVLRGASDFCHGSFDECTNCACWKTILAGAQKEATK